ncbi:MAG: potassium channel family protein [bacterium]
MNVIIVGGGKTLFFLCRNFNSKGHKVTIVNKKRDECINMSRQLTATIICGDGSDQDVLKEAGAIGAGAVLAVTNHDHDNLIICQIAKINFNVPRTIALSNDPDNKIVFESLGITAFSTVEIIASLIEHRASIEQVMNIIPVSEGRVNITEIILDDSCSLVGEFLKNINLPDNALIAVITRGDKSIVPRGNNKLLKGDRLVLITLPENHGQVMKIFTGETN